MPQRQSRPLAAAPLAAVMFAALFAAPALAQSGYIDPANVDAIASPRAQRQTLQSAQAIAEAVVGRPANATDQEILRKYAGVQSSFMQQLQNAAGAAANQYDDGRDDRRYDDSNYGRDAYGNVYDRDGFEQSNGGFSASELQALTELSRTPEGRRVLERMNQQGYGAGGGNGSGTPKQVLRDAFLQDLLNAASNAAARPVYRQYERRP
jgi:hypothetical protein